MEEQMSLPSYELCAMREELLIMLQFVTGFLTRSKNAAWMTFVTGWRLHTVTHAAIQIIIWDKVLRTCVHFLTHMCTLVLANCMSVTRVYGLELSIITVHVPNSRESTYMTSWNHNYVEVISFSIMLHYKMTSTLLRKNKNWVNVSV